MKKRIIVCFGLLICSFLFVLQGCVDQSSRNKVCFKEKCIKVELARSTADLRRGLQFRESLGEDEGMLFIFPHSGKHLFWMQDTLIPLDMIWIGYGQNVVHIQENVPPCEEINCPLYGPKDQVPYVLEINAHRAAALGITKGSRLDFRLKDLE